MSIYFLPPQDIRPFFGGDLLTVRSKAYRTIPVGSKHIGDAPAREHDWGGVAKPIVFACGHHGPSWAGGIDEAITRRGS